MATLSLPIAWPLTHTLTLQTLVNDFGDGFEIRANVNQPFERADGEGGVTEYRGRNSFILKLNAMQHDNLGGPIKYANIVWAFFKARKGSLEGFFFYNPAENDTPDPTGVDTLGRYCVRFKDNMMTREQFVLKLFNTGIELIEVRCP